MGAGKKQTYLKARIHTHTAQMYEKQAGIPKILLSLCLPSSEYLFLTP